MNRRTFFAMCAAAVMPREQLVWIDEPVQMSPMTNEEFWRRVDQAANKYGRISERCNYFPVNDHRQGQF